jgi:hypothetical protein
MGPSRQRLGVGPASVNFTGYKEWDTLVINMGHHQSSALWRMTQREFRKRFDKYLR